MFEWSESQQTIREMVRRFVEQEVVPHVKELEHGDLPPYGILRKMYAAFGMNEMARARAFTSRSRPRSAALPARRRAAARRIPPPVPIRRRRP